jgi:hypothetical protein
VNHNPVVLHVSLRDLAPEIMLASILDDVMAGRVSLPAERPVVFSPFGLGVLDLAVGKYVLRRAAPLRMIGRVPIISGRGPRTASCSSPMLCSAGSFSYSS